MHSKPDLPEFVPLQCCSFTLIASSVHRFVTVQQIQEDYSKVVKESTFDWSLLGLGFEAFKWRGGTRVTASRQLEDILMLT